MAEIKSINSKEGIEQRDKAREYLENKTDKEELKEEVERKTLHEADLRIKEGDDFAEILIKIIKQQEELMLDMLVQTCEEKGIIDNRCISAYEDTCDYLHKKGYLIKINDRAYKLSPKIDELTEIKTLKDLKPIKGLTIMLSKDMEKLQNEEFIFLDELRQEAIKWIKECYLKGRSMGKSTRGVDMFFWMERFNITDEDLK